MGWCIANSALQGDSSQTLTCKMIFASKHSRFRPSGSPFITILPTVFVWWFFGWCIIKSSPTKIIIQQSSQLSLLTNHRGKTPNKNQKIKKVLHPLPLPEKQTEIFRTKELCNSGKFHGESLEWNQLRTFRNLLKTMRVYDFRFHNSCNFFGAHPLQCQPYPSLGKALFSGS